MRHKSDAAELFKEFLADSRADDVPSKVVIVRSDGGGEFRGGEFGDLCRTRGIKQEFTTADSPQFNGVAERALGLIETAAMAGRIQARELYPGAQLPATDSLWAEASHWACDALNRTATTANPESKSPYEMWYGRPPPVVLLPFLKPGYCKVKRENLLKRLEETIEAMPENEMSDMVVGMTRDELSDKLESYITSHRRDVIQFTLSLWDKYSVDLDTIEEGRDDAAKLLHQFTEELSYVV